MTPETTEKKKDKELTGMRPANGFGRRYAGDHGRKYNRPTGQDHSTDHHERQAPTEGVGAIQSENDTTSDIAHLEE